MISNNADDTSLMTRSAERLGETFGQMEEELKNVGLINNTFMEIYEVNKTEERQTK